MCEDTMLTRTTGDRLLEKLWSCISNVKVYAAKAVISRGMYFLVVWKLL